MAHSRDPHQNPTPIRRLDTICRGDSKIFVVILVNDLQGGFDPVMPYSGRNSELHLVSTQWHDLNSWLLGAFKKEGFVGLHGNMERENVHCWVFQGVGEHERVCIRGVWGCFYENEPD